MQLFRHPGLVRLFLIDPICIKPAVGGLATGPLPGGMEFRPISHFAFAIYQAVRPVGLTPLDSGYAYATSISTSSPAVK